MFSGNCGRTACCGGKGGGGLLGNDVMCRLAIQQENFAGSKLGECVGDAFKVRVLHDESLHSLFTVLCVYSIARKTVNEQLNSRCRFSAVTATFMVYKDIWSRTAGEERACARVSSNSYKGPVRCCGYARVLPLAHISR